MMYESDRKNLNISRYFLSMAPIDLILSEAENVLTWEDDDQEELIQQTICHPLAVKFPPSACYKKRFLKKVMKWVEENGGSVNETIYIHYANLIAGSDEESYYFVTYLLDSMHAVTLQETNYLVSEGTTGLKTWQAGKHLAEWCSEHAFMFKDKKVLELGCGLGLTGLVICKLCAPASYYFTDCHPTILRLLEKNINTNLRSTIEQSNHLDCHQVCAETGNSSAAAIKHCVGPLVQERRERRLEANLESHSPEILSFCLDWDLTTEDTIKNLEYDIILAADVLFDPEVSVSFVKVLNMLLCHNPQSEALVACAVRNSETVDLFINSAGAEHLQCIEVDPPSISLFWHNGSIPVRIFKLVSQKK